ncbi:MAG: glycosyltransferase family 4 protein [Phycisphaerae bacterium]|jgi:glycosyltransferase involved in cell wall biosynthesis
MHIVHIITRLIVGGAQENTLITCREQALAGHRVTLITGPSLGPEGSLMNSTRECGYDVVVLKELEREIRPLTDITAYRKLKELLVELKPDVVHTHSAKAGILGRVAGWNIKDEDKKPLVVHTVHGLAFHDYQSNPLNMLYVVIEKFAAKRCDAIISVADAMSEKCIAKKIGRPEMYSTAYSAIDVDTFLKLPAPEQTAAFRERYDIPLEAVVLVCVARIAELKGHEYIIKSAKELAARHPDCVWLFVGNGHLTDITKERIAAAGLSDKFRFTGLLSPEEIPLAIHSSDILVHCSLREGLARVLPQAMLCGKPAVSFDIDGAREVVFDSTGRLIAPLDIASLTSACEELISSKELREMLGAAGREFVRERWSPESMLKSIYAAYETAFERLNA